MRGRILPNGWRTPATVVDRHGRRLVPTDGARRRGRQQQHLTGMASACGLVFSHSGHAPSRGASRAAGVQEARPRTPGGRRLGQLPEATAFRPVDASAGGLRRGPRSAGEPGELAQARRTLDQRQQEARHAQVRAQPRPAAPNAALHLLGRIARPPAPLGDASRAISFSPWYSLHLLTRNTARSSTIRTARTMSTPQNPAIDLIV